MSNSRYVLAKAVCEVVGRHLARNAERERSAEDRWRRVSHLEMVMRECCDAIRDNDDMGALRMLEIALKEQAPAHVDSTLGDVRNAFEAWDADRKPRIKNGPTARAAADPALRAIAADMSLTSKQAAAIWGCHYNTIRAVRRALRESKGLQAKKTGV